MKRDEVTIFARCSRHGWRGSEEDPICIGCAEAQGVMHFAVKWAFMTLLLGPFVIPLVWHLIANH